jgi:hypothetical protein
MMNEFNLPNCGAPVSGSGNAIHLQEPYAQRHGGLAANRISTPTPAEARYAHADATSAARHQTANPPGSPP